MNERCEIPLCNDMHVKSLWFLAIHGGKILMRWLVIAWVTFTKHNILGPTADGCNLCQWDSFQLVSVICYMILILSRCSIIAAANPVGGHYTKARTVSENLRMGSALLSRFDLVFILVDTPDEEKDR